MDDKQLKDIYYDFFTSGAYKLGKLLVLKADTIYKNESGTYDLLSLLKWQENDYDRGKEMLKRIQRREQARIKDIRAFIYALFDVILKLPYDRATAINNRYGRDTKPKEDGNSAHRMARVVMPNFFEELFADDSGYDFRTDGVAAIAKLKYIMEIGRESELSAPARDVTKLYPIENAMDAVRIYKKPEFQDYSMNVQEMVISDQDIDDISAELKPKIKRMGKSYHIFAEVDEKHAEKYLYYLYGDGKFMTMGYYPSFLEEKERIDKLKAVSSLKIIVRPKGKPGEEYIPDELSIGETTRFTLTAFPQICDYVLLKDGIQIARKKQPFFIIKNRDPNAEYRVRLVKNDDDVDDALAIKRMFGGLPTKTGLERKTAINESNSMLDQMYNVSQSLNVLKKNLPYKYQKMLKYRDNEKLERRVDTFWELSCMLLDLDAIFKGRD